VHLFAALAAGLGTMGGPVEAFQVEVGGLTLEAEEFQGVLEVKAWSEEGERLWGPRFPLLPGAAGEGVLVLSPTVAGPEAARGRRAYRALRWDGGTTREALAGALAELWWERAGGETLSSEAAPWMLDWLTVSLLAAREEGGHLRWRALAGGQPMALADLLREVPGTAPEVRAQRWLLGEWVEARPEAARSPEAETRWAAWFLDHTSHAGEGPFLSLEASARRLRALGLVNIRRRGAEERIWLSELPVAERLRWRGHWETRGMHLRALLPRVHPLYHRAAVALAGTVTAGDEGEAAVWAAAFAPAWADAEQAADEIHRLLHAGE
jgi:hypothetical protein